LPRSGTMGRIPRGFLAPIRAELGFLAAYSLMLFIFNQLCQE
jgi:hypothetical protein